MKIVFAGSPKFAIPTLERLVAAGHEIAAVFTQPDRPAGRDQVLQPPPLKEAALRLALRVEQPERRFVVVRLGGGFSVMRHPQTHGK